MKEAELLKHCILAAAQCGATMFRNNRGMFLTLDGKRKTQAGLSGAGSSDLVGFSNTGQFIAIEVKTKTGRVSLDQQRFIDAVNAAGGLAFVARSAEDVRKHLMR